jgi:hypothetical protein
MTKNIMKKPFFSFRLYKDGLSKEKNHFKLPRVEEPIISKLNNPDNNKLSNLDFNELVTYFINQINDENPQNRFIYFLSKY